MGRRISYYITNKGGSDSLKELIKTHYVAFRKWYLEEDKTSKEEFNEPLGKELFLSFLHQNVKLPEIDTIVPVLCDELTIEFLYYCDSGMGTGLVIPVGSSLHPRRYEKSTEWICQVNNKELEQFWNYLITGRSIIQDKPFNSLSAEIVVGFWTVLEQEKLYKLLTTTFGTIKEIRSKYWTMKEKESYALAIEKSLYLGTSFSIANYNPDSQGIEQILFLLEEVKGKEIIIVTEL